MLAQLSPTHRALAGTLAWESWSHPRALRWEKEASAPYRAGWEHALRTLPMPETVPLEAWVSEAPQALLRVAMDRAPASLAVSWKLFFKRFTNSFGQLCGQPATGADRDLACLLELLPKMLARHGGEAALAQCPPGQHPWEILGKTHVVPEQIIALAKHWPVPETLDLEALAQGSPHGALLAAQARSRRMHAQLPEAPTRPRLRM